MRRLTLLLLALVASLASSQSVQLAGHAAATFGVAVGGTLPVAAAEVALTLSGEVGSGFFPDASYSASIVAGYDAASGSSTLELDEARVTAYLGELELSAGKLRRAWGSTDGVNPVDVLNPHDMSFPPEQGKVAVPMLHGVYYADGVSIELALLPVFVPSTLPGPAWRPTFSPDLPQGVTVVGVLPAEERRPAAELNNVQFGVRASMQLSRFDVSATYFRGFRSEPTMSARLEPAGAPGQMLLQPILSYDRVNVLGLDFSGVIGDVVLRGEAAYTIAETPGDAAATGSDSLQAVLGGEYLIPGGPRTVLQAIYDYSAPTQVSDSSSSLKFMTALLYEPTNRTQVEVGWVQSLDGSGLFKPSLTYSFADGVRGEAVGYVFYGGAGTEFGDFRENSQLRLSLVYDF